MGKLRLYSLYLSLFLTFTQGLWERLLSFNPVIELLTELSVLAFIILSIRNIIFKKNPLNLSFLILISLSLLSSIINQSGFFEWYKYMRYFIYTYLIYSVFWSSIITYVQWRNLLRFVICLIVAQGVGSIINIFILGIRVEGYVGIMSTLGGTTAAIFPLFVITIVLLGYLFNINLSRKYVLITLLISLSVLFVGYASGKRAVYFIIPVFIMLSVLVSSLYNKQTRNFYYKVLGLIMFILVLIPLYMYGIKNSGGINQGLTGNENYSKIFSNALDYAFYYSESTSEDGFTGGRNATTMNLIERSTSNIVNFLFGYGYGVHKEKSSRNSLKFVYGIVGFTRDLLGGGLVLVIMTIWMFVGFIFINKSAGFKFSKALRVIIFLVFLYSYFFYSSDFTVHLKINYLFLILLAFINSPKHYVTLESVVNKYFY